MEKWTTREQSVTNQYVARIIGMGSSADSEYITCEMPGGTICDMLLSGTDLDGWVTSRAMFERDGLSALESWAEFGVTDDGSHYIEILYGQVEFDWLPIHAYNRRHLPMSMYDYWKELHRVEVRGCPAVPLYYGMI